jgi:hypothetical protein
MLCADQVVVRPRLIFLSSSLPAKNGWSANNRNCHQRQCLVCLSLRSVRQMAASQVRTTKKALPPVCHRMPFLIESYQHYSVVVAVELRGPVEYANASVYHPATSTPLHLAVPASTAATTTLVVPLSVGDPTGCAVVRLIPRDNG